MRAAMTCASDTSPAVRSLRGQPQPHPNEVDFKRIERSLKARERYRYVTPTVVRTTNGYRIESHCCSRNIDETGGVIDVAMLQFDEIVAEWRLFRKDHQQAGWVLHSTYPRLVELLKVLGVDAEREFWQ